MMNNVNVLYFLEFVERLPLSDDQKMQFVQNHISNIKKAELEKQRNREHFRSVVLVNLLKELDEAQS